MVGYVPITPTSQAFLFRKKKKVSISSFWGVNGQRFGKFPLPSRSTLFYGCLWRFDIKRIVQCFDSFFLVLGCAARVIKSSPPDLVQVSFMCGGRAQNDACRVSSSFIDCSQFPKRCVVTVGFKENLVSWVISFCGSIRGPTHTCLLWQQFFKNWSYLSRKHSLCR